MLVNNTNQHNIGLISNNTSGYGAGSGLVYLNAGDRFTLRSAASISGWGAGHRLSVFRISGSSTIGTSETVAARYTCTVAQALTTTPAIINFDKASYDTHGAVQTGAAWNFKAPVSGKYRVTARFLSALNTTIQRLELVLYKNNAAYSAIVTGSQNSVTSGRIDASGSDTIQLFAGDAIDIRGAVTAGSNALSSDGPYNFVTIERIGN
jgi:hypothetical protein